MFLNNPDYIHSKCPHCRGALKRPDGTPCIHVTDSKGLHVSAYEPVLVATFETEGECLNTDMNTVASSSA